MTPDQNDGFKVSLGYPKGDLLVEITTLLAGLADDAGYESIASWVKSDDFDAEDLVNEHGASHRMTKFKGKFYHNYEWSRSLGTKGTSEYRVGLVLVTKRINGSTEYAQLSARRWFGEADD